MVDSNYAKEGFSTLVQGGQVIMTSMPPQGLNIQPNIQIQPASQTSPISRPSNFPVLKASPSGSFVETTNRNISPNRRSPSQTKKQIDPSRIRPEMPKNLQMPISPPIQLQHLKKPKELTAEERAEREKATVYQTRILCVHNDHRGVRYLNLAFLN